MTYLNTRAFGVAPLPYYREPKPEPCEAKGCTEPVSGLTPAGAYACEFHVTMCDSDHAPAPLDAEGWCRVCDPCRCGEESTDRATGYVDTCPLHPAAVPAPDALARLTASLCTCTSDEFDRTPCAVHGKAV